MQWPNLLLIVLTLLIFCACAVCFRFLCSPGRPMLFGDHACATPLLQCTIQIQVALHQLQSWCWTTEHRLHQEWVNNTYCTSLYGQLLGWISAKLQARFHAHWQHKIPCYHSWWNECGTFQRLKAADSKKILLSSAIIATMTWLWNRIVASKFNCQDCISWLPVLPRQAPGAGSRTLPGTTPWSGVVAHTASLFLMCPSKPNVTMFCCAWFKLILKKTLDNISLRYLDGCVAFCHPSLRWAHVGLTPCLGLTPSCLVESVIVIMWIFSNVNMDKLYTIYHIQLWREIVWMELDMVCKCCEEIDHRRSTKE